MRFSKWHALGNAYILLERAELGRPLDGAFVRRVCDDRTGIGSDGVIEVVEMAGTSAAIVIWNPDGTTAEISGNGARIAARWLSRRVGADAVSLTVGPRTVTARMRSDSLVETEMGKIEVAPSETLDVGGEPVDVVPVSVGNPHAVVRAEPARAELLRLGPQIERHERFPGRTNVQLIQVDGEHDVSAAVWERGAGETMSSGSSACAIAAAAVANGWCRSPVTVHLAGGSLQVLLDGQLEARLIGPAEEICSGRLADDFLVGEKDD